MTQPLHPAIERETTRRGYWIAAGLVVAAIGIFALMLWRTYAAVEAMPRIPASGDHVVDLAAGDVLIYGELASPMATGNITCRATDRAGSPLKLTTPSSTTSYEIGDHNGRSMFELDVGTSGPVTIHCDTEADVVLAFGPGLGTRIAAGVTVPLLAGLAAFILGLRTFFRRRWEKRLRREPAPITQP